MATIHQCMYRGTRMTQQCGLPDQGKRSKCKGCKSDIRAITGHAVVVEHRGDGRYTLADAVKEFATLAAAERSASSAYAADSQSSLVARFLI
jgi:hypothetical protein